MTAEKTIELAFTIAMNHNPELFERFKENPIKFKDNPYSEILSACAALIEDARTDMDKKAGNGSALTAAKRIIKAAKGRAKLEGAWTNADGLQCLCDGIRAVRLKNPLAGLPASSGIDIDRFFTDAQRGEKLTVPTAAELKQVLAAHKASGSKARPVYDWGDGLPAVDAEYLRDMLAILPGAEIHANECGALSPIYFDDNSGNGLLMPVRKAAKA